MMEIISQIKGLTADSRDVRAGYLFAALQGENSDGRDFIEQAVASGATHILAQTGTVFPDAVTAIESDHPRRDFARLAAAFYKKQPETMVAVTGTNGKTSVADFVRQILTITGKQAGSIGTLGVKSHALIIDGAMTTPDPVTLHHILAQLSDNRVTHAVMEASSHGLHQNRLDGVKLSVAAFTNLTQDHLDYHKNMDAYFDAKKRLFTDILPEGGVAVINADDLYGQTLNHANSITYGMAECADLRIVSHEAKPDGQVLEISYKDHSYSIELSLIGLFQAYNVLCAAGCALACGLDEKSVFAALPKLQGVPGRMQLAATHDGAAAYIDYAHTPDALSNALKSLRPHVKGRLICVFGAGGDRDKTKRPLMGKAVNDAADIAVITDDNPRSEDPTTIRNEISSACPKAENIGGRAKAIAYAASLLNAGDVLLVAGKGHEQGQTIGKTTHPFDDLTETRKAMEALIEHD